MDDFPARARTCFFTAQRRRLPGLLRDAAEQNRSAARCHLPEIPRGGVPPVVGVVVAFMARHPADAITLLQRPSVMSLGRAATIVHLLALSARRGWPQHAKPALDARHFNLEHALPESRAWRLHNALSGTLGESSTGAASPWLLVNSPYAVTSEAECLAGAGARQSRWVPGLATRSIQISGGNQDRTASVSR